MTSPTFSRLCNKLSLKVQLITLQLFLQVIIEEVRVSLLANIILFTATLFSKINCSSEVTLKTLFLEPIIDTLFNDTVLGKR